jgi:hypothetical protein
MSDNKEVSRAETPVQKVLNELERLGSPAREGPSGWQARCPAHDDRAPSLSLREGRDGRALLHCHAGCETKAVLAALHLRFSDLFPDSYVGGRRRAGQ